MAGAGESGGAVETASDIVSILSKPMDERRRWLLKTISIVRFDIRTLFGLSFANKWGFYIDHHMSRKIHEFSDWMAYKKGDAVLDIGSKPVFSAVISCDGYYLYTGCNGPSIIVWNLLTQDMNHKWDAHTDSIWSFAYKPGYLVSGSKDMSIRVWKLYENNKLIHDLKGHTSTVSCLQFNQKGDLIASGGEDHFIRLWSFKTGECLRYIRRHIDKLRSVHFVSGTLISGANDLSIRVWDHSTGKQTGITLEGSDHQLHNISVNCDESLIACASINALSVYLWPSLKMIRYEEMDAYRSYFHPTNPDLIAVGGYVKTKGIKMYNVRSGETIQTFEGHISLVNCICFTPDSQLMISVSWDRSIRVWDISGL